MKAAVLLRAVQGCCWSCHGTTYASSTAETLQELQPRWLRQCPPAQAAVLNVMQTATPAGSRATAPVHRQQQHAHTTGQDD